MVDRPGKQPDGSSKTREIKLVRIWSAEERDKESTPVRDATVRGFERAARRAVLGDGAIWIWNLAAAYLPDAVQIVDRFHAKTAPLGRVQVQSMTPGPTSHSRGRANAMTSCRWL